MTHPQIPRDLGPLRLDMVAGASLFGALVTRAAPDSLGAAGVGYGGGGTQGHDAAARGARLNVSSIAPR